jgi:hypothetical protein
MTKALTLIQFHNATDNSDDRGSSELVGKWFILGDSDRAYEFYDGDDDDTGESIYVEKDCILYYDTIEDFINENNEGYMVQKRLRYSLFEIELPTDSNDNIILEIA